MDTVFVVTRMVLGLLDHQQIVSVFKNEATASEFCKNMNTIVKNGYYYMYDPHEYNTI
jgi:hypothetical protein